MKNKALAMSILALMLTACETDNNPKKEPSNPISEEGDNTDQNFTNVAPNNQLENESDRKITQSLRKALKSDDTLSANAKNIKIITKNGVVTLRGVVDSIQEKNTIDDLINQVRGIRRVDDQLDVK